MNTLYYGDSIPSFPLVPFSRGAKGMMLNWERSESPSPWGEGF